MRENHIWKCETHVEQKKEKKEKVIHCIEDLRLIVQMSIIKTIMIFTIVVEKFLTFYLIKN